MEAPLGVSARVRFQKYKWVWEASRVGCGERCRSCTLIGMLIQGVHAQLHIYFWHPSVVWSVQATQCASKGLGVWLCADCVLRRCLVWCFAGFSYVSFVISCRDLKSYTRRVAQKVASKLTPVLLSYRCL